MVNITLQWPFSVILIRTSQIGTYIMKYPLFRLEFGSTQNWNWRKRLFCLFWDALLLFFSENRVMQLSAKGWHEAVEHSHIAWGNHPAVWSQPLKMAIVSLSGWWFQTFGLCSIRITLYGIILPIDFINFRGVGQPPTSL